MIPVVCTFIQRCCLSLVSLGCAAMQAHDIANGVGEKVRAGEEWSRCSTRPRLLGCSSQPPVDALLVRPTLRPLLVMPTSDPGWPVRRRLASSAGQQSSIVVRIPHPNSTDSLRFEKVGVFDEEGVEG
jgi:hypothetical protein